jgi:tight adherence protein B
MIVGALILHNILLGLLLAVLGMQLPVFWLHSRRQQRQHRFQAQLVDVISMLVSGLRAGVGLIQAMDLVRREMPRPAGVEFGRVVQENGLGVSLEEALGRLLERMPGDDLSMVITVIKIQAEVGGNLANVLDGVITTIRERVRIAQEIRTLTAQQRFTGYLLAGMPFFVAGAIMFINPGFLMPLFSPQWLWLPAMAVVMIVVGFVVISRIVDIKV